MLVAVCSERGGPVLERSVAAVAAQSARVVLVLAGDARAPAPLPAGVEIIRTAPGMAQARNAALGASDAQVVALVDGDVVVADGWVEALADAWERADDDVAAIGGPLTAAVDGGRFPPELAAHLPTLDLGDAEIDVDPRERTL